MPNRLETHFKRITLGTTDWQSLEDIGLPSAVYRLEIRNTSGAMNLCTTGDTSNYDTYDQNEVFRKEGQPGMTHRIDNIEIAAAIGNVIVAEYEM